MPSESIAVETEAKSAKPRKPRVAKPKSIVEDKTLRGHARTLADQATTKARDAAKQGVDKAGDLLDDVAATVEDSAAHIDKRFGKAYGDYARKAAEGVASAASSVKGKDVEELLDAARLFVKKNPLVAAGAAAAVGFALTRLFRTGGDDTDA